MTKIVQMILGLPAALIGCLARLVRWIVAFVAFPFVLLLSVYFVIADIWDSTEKYDAETPWRWWNKIQSNDQDQV